MGEKSEQDAAAELKRIREQLEKLVRLLLIVVQRTIAGDVEL